MTQTETHYLGLIVSTQGGAVLSRSRVEGRPTADDLAALLAGAMMRPLTGPASRPGRVHVRCHRPWRGLFPDLEDLGIEVSVHRELPHVQIVYADHVRQAREVRRVGMVPPTSTQSAVGEAFPAIAEWVRGHGHIEIGEQETFGFVVRAIDAGGVILELAQGGFAGRLDVGADGDEDDAAGGVHGRDSRRRGRAWSDCTGNAAGRGSAPRGATGHSGPRAGAW